MMKAKPMSPSKKKPTIKKMAVKKKVVKKKPACPLKGKTVSTVKKTLEKKVIPTAKRKTVSTARRKTVSPPKKKPVSIAKKKLELRNQVEVYFKGKPKAYFVVENERTKDGAYIVCVAVEGEAGFYKMDWAWHSSFAKAKAETALLNEKLGFSEEEVNSIIISTM
jgi:hypothetical protein